LKRHGVKAASYEHYCQMVCYMDYLGFERAFYLAVCKDTDELYSERIHSDPAFATILKDKAEDHHRFFTAYTNQ